MIPDCHPLPVEYTAITYEIQGLEIHIRVEVHTVYKTGVEVEAMHGASVVALTMYDMLKPIDPEIEITQIRLQEKKGGKSDLKYAYPKSLPTAVVTCSDTLAAGRGSDLSGEVVQSQLERHGLTAIRRVLVADQEELIRETVQKLKEEGVLLVVLTGGTGLSEKDVTPEAILPLIDREVPGVMEAARSYGQSRTPYAMLSRGLAGFSGDTLLIALPGSPRGAEESMQAIFPSILHVFRVKEGVRHD
jgi:molybdenum cofactor synthesis domain-containing protein